jgi:hypothetical protein
MNDRPTLDAQDIRAQFQQQRRMPPEFDAQAQPQPQQFGPHDILSVSLEAQEWNAVFLSMQELQNKIGALTVKMREQMMGAGR